MSVKDFEKGMEAGAKPFAAKYQQYAEALGRLQEDFNRNLGAVKGVTDAVLGELDNRQREKVFGANTQFDIKNLTDFQKDILVATLYTLAKESSAKEPSNEKQKGYIRSVQNYLDKRNPPTDFDFSAIEELDVDSSKAIFQACVEYLYLANETPEFFGEYDETLFSRFNINPNIRLSLWKNVVNIFLATGSEGLAEKYGFVPEAIEENSESEADTSAVLEKKIIDSVLFVPAGEQMAFREREVVFEADIDCAGTLLFENCVVIYDRSKTAGKIKMRDDASVSFVSCTIKDLAHEEKNRSTPIRFLHHSSYEKRANVMCKDCLFIDCLDFLDSHNSKTKIDSCVIRYTTELPDDAEFMRHSSSFGSEDESEISNCLFENTTGITPKIRHWYNGRYLLFGFQAIKNCTFRNIRGVTNMSTTVDKCLFEKCSLAVNDSITVSSCLFIECRECIYIRRMDPQIHACQFYNTKKCGIFFNSIEAFYPHAGHITDCLFDGFDPLDADKSEQGYLITCGEKIAKGWNNFPALYVEKSIFKHCVTSNNGDLINIRARSSRLFGDKEVVAIWVHDCQGLANNNREGSAAVNPLIRNETEQGEPIGARLEGIFGAEPESVEVKKDIV